MSRYDYTLVGAGIVGLASAFKLKQAKPSAKVAIVEKESDVAAHQTGHNSGVIHSGVYYKPDSYKARLCLQGYAELLEFATQNDIPHKICGKLIVAVNEAEVSRLAALQERAKANGLDGVKRLGAEAAKEIEPYVECKEALYVPQTGVIDYKVVSQRLKKLLIGGGVDFYFDESVLNISHDRSGVTALTSKRSLQTKYLINCAGLYSDKISEMDQELRPQEFSVGSGDDLLAGRSEIRILPFRGEYYDLTADAAGKVKGLIYPVADPAFPFLGVHLTRGIDGHVEAGPNAVLALRREGYRWNQLNIDELFESLTWPGLRRIAANHWRMGLEEVWRSISKPAFLSSLQKLVPSLTAEDLVVGGSGVRAQASHKYGELLDDFCFEESSRCLHVLNAPSPAATSCFAIGAEVAKRALTSEVNL